jgi:hypothetical protein
VGKYGRAGQAADDNITRRMRFACWITKAIDTLRICNTYSFSVAAVVTRTRLLLRLYVHCLSCSVSLTTDDVDTRPILLCVLRAAVAGARLNLFPPLQSTSVCRLNKPHAS